MTEWLYRWLRGPDQGQKPVSMPHPVQWLGLLVLGILLAIGVLLTIPPWSHYFASGYGEHWDTRLMGQWMSFNAQQILDGRVLLPDFDANFFYPHANTLAFSEALWPQSFVYALIYWATGNPFLSFNGTMLAFWALSGVMMYLLTMQLGAGRACALLAATIFCLMPYRLAYYIEFNMSLTFCVPLLWLAYVRWINAPTLWRSVWFAVAFWISLTSTIYYTIIAGLILCVVHVIDLFHQPRRLVSRNYWQWAGALAVICAALSLVFLEPYLELRLSGNYARTHADFLQHYLQVGHYIYPAAFNVDYAILGFGLDSPDVRTAETIAFPGAVLASLTLLFLLDRALLILPGEAPRAVPYRLVELFKLTLWTAFFAIVIYSWLGQRPNAVVVPPVVLYVIAAGILTTTVGHALMRCPRGDSQLLAFGAGAVVAFFISLGPRLTIGVDTAQADLGTNPVGWMLEYLPVFDAVRGLSRFSIVVLTFLTIAGCYTLHRVSRRQPSALWLIPVFAGILIFEGRQNFYKFIDDADQRSDAAIQALADVDRNVPLVQLPIGPRWYDSQAVMLTVKDLRPLVNGHSGFAPDYYLDWSEALRSFDVKTLSSDFLTLWPQPRLIVDRESIEILEKGWKRRFPYDALDEYWELVETGLRYTLYEPRSRVSNASTVTRWMHRNVLARNPRLSFEARSDDSATRVSIDVNDQRVTEQALTSEWQSYEISLDISAGGQLTGDRVTLRRLGGADWQVRSVGFLPAPPAG